MKKFLTLLLLSLCLTAQSRDIPAELTGKNITVIVPYGPGGNSDITARQLAKTVEQVTGLNIMVVNRPGASGTIGYQALTHAVPNGFTLGLFETGPAIVNTIQGLPNSPTRDQLVPVSASIESSLALIVGADTPANTVQEFVLYLQQQKQYRKIIPVGTTSMRTLESLYWMGVQIIEQRHLAGDFSISQWEPYESENNYSVDESLTTLISYAKANELDFVEGFTQIIIAPGYQFKIIDGLITNFHQPQSTLLLLVSALIGNDWRKVYEHALQNNYRFLSYGDSSLLLP